MFVISCEPIQYSMHPRGGWHDLTERKQMLGQRSERSSVRSRCLKTYCVYLFNPERCLMLIGNSTQATGKLRFGVSKPLSHRVWRNQGANPSSVKLRVY